MKKIRFFNLYALIVAFSLSAQFVYGQAEDAEAADDESAEVIIVTAQRINEDIQDVPVAVSALTDDMLGDQQVIGTTDLQLNVPSLSFTETNFGGNSTSIRGVGQLIISSVGEPGVSIHINEIPFSGNLNVLEFLDLERVEVLRGPQSTLFGRNATGGSINFVTKKPVVGENSGRLVWETGSHNHSRTRAIGNLAITENLALRVAASRLERDGYTKNLAYNQVGRDGETLPGLSEYLDGRDSSVIRATIGGQLTEKFSGWFMWERYEEDSDRSRIKNQICIRNELPTIGCTANGVGFESPHLGANTGGIFGGAIGAVPLGVSGEDTSMFNWVRPSNLDLRSVHTDFHPVFQNVENILAYGFEYDTLNFNLGVIGAKKTWDILSMNDYNFDVGANLSPTLFNPSGIWPSTAPRRHPGYDTLDGDCNLLNGTAGVYGACVDSTPYTRIFSFDESAGTQEYRTIEFKMRSKFTGDFNFLLGISQHDVERYGDYGVYANTLDMVSVYGLPALGIPPLYPGYFNNKTNPAGGTGREGAALFGEAYFDLSPSTTLTAGMRLHRDDITISDTSVLFNAWNHQFVIPGVHAGLIEQAAASFGIPADRIPLQLAVAGAIALGLLDPDYLFNLNYLTSPHWSRTNNILLGPFAPGAPETDLALYHGVDPAELAAALLSPAYSRARVEVSQKVPIVPTFGEARAVTNSPNEGSYTEVSGRIGLDYRIDPRSMVYGFISRGYKPGGLNSAIPVSFQELAKFDYEPESIWAYEVGYKSNPGGSISILNATGFFYQYDNMQTTRIKYNSAINENIDAQIYGLEVESVLRFENLPRWTVDVMYSYLNTSIVDAMSVDPINRIAGQDGWVLLKNIDPGSSTGVSYVARESQISPQLVELALASGAALDLRNGLAAADVSYPTNEHGASIPAYFSSAFLTAAGVEVSEGNLTDLDGNALPSTPEHSLRVGLTHFRPSRIFNGTMIYRIDGYIQSESYAREFNTIGDQIDAWAQLNASIIYENNNLIVRFWARNLLDDNNVTGHYLTSDTSGFFRNYFMTEPRIMGLSVVIDMQ